MKTIDCLINDDIFIAVENAAIFKKQIVVRQRSDGGNSCCLIRYECRESFVSIFFSC